MREFYLLQQEAYLIRSSLCIGLNSISKGNIGEKGEFYSCFFSLSIGIERLAKLSVILNQLLENNFEFPSNEYLKKLGHNLLKLYSVTTEAASKRFPNKIEPLKPNSIERKILEFLSEFSQNSRYYNLNVLGGNTTNENPLTLWFLILIECMKLDSSKADRLKIDAMLRIGKSMEDRSAGMSSGMGESEITITDQFGQNALIHNSSKHIQVRVIRVINVFKNILESLTDECHKIILKRNPQTPAIPFFCEFFTFLGLEEKDLKRKKRWP